MSEHNTQQDNLVEKTFSEGKRITLSETSKEILKRRLAEFRLERGGQNNG